MGVVHGRGVPAVTEPRWWTSPAPCAFENLAFYAAGGSRRQGSCRWPVITSPLAWAHACVSVTHYPPPTARASVAPRPPCAGPQVCPGRGGACGPPSRNRGRHRAGPRAPGLRRGRLRGAAVRGLVPQPAPRAPHAQVVTPARPPRPPLPHPLPSRGTAAAGALAAGPRGRGERCGARAERRGGTWEGGGDR